MEIIPPPPFLYPIFKHQYSNNLQNTSTKPVPADDGNSKKFRTPDPVLIVSKLK